MNILIVEMDMLAIPVIAYPMHHFYRNDDSLISDLGLNLSINMGTLCPTVISYALIIWYNAGFISVCE